MAKEDYDRFWSPAFDNMGDLVCLIDSDYNLVRVNKSFSKFVGKDENDLVGKKCYEIVHSSDKPFPGCPHEKMLATKVSEKADFFEPRLKRWFSVTATPIWSNDHKLLGSIHIVEDFTRLKDDKEKLKVRNDFIDQSMAPFAVGDLNGNLVYVNSACLKLWGYASDKEVLGKPIMEFWEGKERIIEILEACKDKNCWIGELTAKRKNGKTFDCHVVTNVITDDSNQPLYLAASFTDSTELRRLEDALHENKEKYQKIVDGSTDCVYLLNNKGCLIYANKQALMLNEITNLESFIGTSFINLATARYKGIISDSIKAVLSGESKHLHYETITPSKRHRWWNATLFPLRDAKERVVNILNISRDLTIERESRAREEFFKEYAENILANVPISVLVVNRSGQIIFTNRNFLSKMKAKESSVIGRPLTKVVPADILGKTNLSRQMTEVLKTKDAIAGQKFDYHGRTFLYNLIPLKEITGRRHNVAIMMEDVTDRVVLEEQLHHSERLAMMGQFAAGVTHEINNPLAIIKGNVQYLRDQIKKGVDFHTKTSFKELKDTLAAVEHEATRCANIISELLHFAKKSDAKQRKQIDINHLVRHILYLMKRQLSLKKIKVVCELSTNTPSVRGNEELLQQVVINLVLNAEQAMGKRGGIITIKTLQDRRKVYIIIKDSGCGIPKEMQQFIFNPFFTTKGSGTGLGLSVAHSIVEDHGGTITVRSWPKRGSVFTVAFPIGK